MAAYIVGVLVWLACGFAWAFSTGRVPWWETMLVSSAVFVVCMFLATGVNAVIDCVSSSRTE